MTARREWNHNIHYFPFVERVAAERARRNALDVGPGDGMLAARLARGIPSVTGLDLDAHQVAAAREAHSGIPGLAFEQGDVLESTPRGAPFDLVTCSATIHHLPLDAALARLADLTAPGGTLIVVGLARDDSIGDLALSAFTLVASKIARARRGWYDHGAPMKDASESWSTVRGTVERVLPGATYRRRLYWRYTVVWEKPLSA